jgi:lipopolysaccharide biosynthesis glycosyltransferase
MNCIFICVFHQTQYLELFFILLETILIYGSLDKNVHVLVYTSTPFMETIKLHKLFDAEKIKFEINDGFNDIESACKSRVHLFKLSSINNYEKILYLDTDVIVKSDINRVFDVCKDDVLYTLEEGSIDVEGDYWGNSLFGNEIHNYVDKSAFTSGILLFKNCENIKMLFQKIIEDMANRPYYFQCYDQPYIVYNAFKYNLYNNKILKRLAVNNNENIDNDFSIHHFPGGPGEPEHKLTKMKRMVDSLGKSYGGFTDKSFNA